MKIVISGGHLTPALATIEWIQSHHPSDEIVMVGRKYSQRNKAQVSQEPKEAAALGIAFIEFETVRSLPQISWKHFSELLSFGPQFTWSIITALKILREIKPDVFLSFGGYLALPIAIAARILKIPVITHEQTTAVGTTTKLIAPWCHQILLTHQESKNYLPVKVQSKCQVIGNPLRPSLWRDQTQPDWLNLIKNKPLVYITGGNQGSEVINLTIAAALKELTTKYQLVHQCGSATQTHQYLELLTTKKNQLPKELQSSYQVREWISAADLAYLYQTAAAVVGRAGANTISELAAFNLPAILIPLPFAHYDEQTKNAEWLQLQLGSDHVKILSQSELTAGSLLAALSQIKMPTRSLKQPSLPPAIEKTHQLLYQSLDHAAHA